MNAWSLVAPPWSATIALVAVVAIAAWQDGLRWRIPNEVLAAGAASALMLAVFSPDGIGVLASLGGGLTGLAWLLPLYLLRGVAAGDVKLLATVGLFTGPLMVSAVALTSFLIGGLWALALLAARTTAGQWVATVWQWMRLRYGPGYVQTPPPLLWEGSRGSIPYGVVIALGTLAMLLAANTK